MRNWLTAAMDDPSQASNPKVDQDALQTVNPPAQKGEEPQSLIQPEPTPTTQENVAKNKAQASQMDNIQSAVVPDVARVALPSLNQSLHFLTTELLSREDLRLQDTSARQLAIEIMLAWLSASRSGGVSDLASIVVKSPRINNLLSTLL